jgi:hypothetical protein
MAAGGDLDAGASGSRSPSVGIAMRSVGPIMAERRRSVPASSGSRGHASGSHGGYQHSRLAKKRAPGMPDPTTRRGDLERNGRPHTLPPFAERHPSPRPRYRTLACEREPCPVPSSRKYDSGRATSAGSRPRRSTPGHCSTRPAATGLATTSATRRRRPRRVTSRTVLHGPADQRFPIVMGLPS